MSAIPFDARSNSPIPFEEIITPDPRFNYRIPVNLFIDHFQVNHPDVRNVLMQYPQLCYMLGRIDSFASETTDRLQPDKVARPIYHLLEGSGMFGLEIPDDAMRWSGIFGHSVGTARQAWHLFNRFKQLTPAQRAEFEKAGFDFDEFDLLTPDEVRDFMSTDHLGRRGWDEKDKDGVNFTHLPEGSPGELTRYLLGKYKAPQVFLELIRIEDHANKLAKRINQEEGNSHFFPNIVDAILTYVDWTFERSPMDLKTRFERLRQFRKDISPEILNILESSGKSFEEIFNRILRTNLFEEIQKIGPYDWEYRIRKAYCAPSGITIQEAFPEYIQQYPGLT